MSHQCLGLHCPGCSGGGNGIWIGVLAAGALLLAGGAAAAIVKAVALLIVLLVLTALAAAVAALWWFVLQIRTGPRGGGLMTVSHPQLEVPKVRAIPTSRRPQLQAGDHHLHLHFDGSNPAEAAAIIRTIKGEHA